MPAATPEEKEELLFELRLLGKQLGEIFGESGSIQFDNRFTRMALYFSNKQIEHLGNLLSWKPTHDFFLIARSMIEGICLLAYAAEERDARALNWEESFYLQKRDQYLDRTDMGLKHPEGTLEEIEKLIIENCTSLIADKSSGNKTVRIGDQHFFRTWHKLKSITTIVKEYGEPAYKSFWSDYSAWHHWETGSFADHALSADELSIGYHGISTIDTMTSILCGVSCTVKTMYIAYERLGQLATCNRLVEISRKAEEIVSRADWKETGT